ncbi:type II toxin-antitoxin system VapC family toxin [Microbispora siamensis]
MILVDAGPLVAAAISNDAHHERCTREFERLFKEEQQLLVTGFVAAELCYWLGKAGPRLEAAFLRSLESGLLTLVDLVKADLARAAVLVERYADLPLGGADASVVAVAERLKVDTVFTIDVRHFSVVRPVHAPAFTLLPKF